MYKGRTLKERRNVQRTDITSKKFRGQVRGMYRVQTLHVRGMCRGQTLQMKECTGDDTLGVT